MASPLRKLMPPPGRRAGAVVGLLVLAAVALLRAADPAPVEQLRLRAFDRLQIFRPRPLQPRVAIIDIDEASLQRYGQWPWPRHLLARLIDELERQRPKVIGMDMLFPESDRLSPEQVLQQRPDLEALLGPLREGLAKLPRNDDLLARSLAAAPVVLGVAGVLVEQQPATIDLQTPPVQLQNAALMLQLQSFDTVVHSIPELERAARGRGNLAQPPERDGIVRRMPLLVRIADRLVPSLDLEMLRIFSHADRIIVRGDRAGMVIQVADLQLPTEPDGRMWIHYSPHLPGRFIPAGDILDGKLHPGELEGRIVLVGLTGIGLLDQASSPLGEPIPGVEVRAQVLEQALETSLGQRLLRRPPWAARAEALFGLVLGLLVVHLVGLLRPLWSTLLPLGLLPLCLAGSLMCYLGPRLLIDPTFPLLLLLLPVPAVLGFNLVAADRKQRAQDADLAAAHRIQMGILPRRFPAFPDRRDFDLHALIEPARAVGGDLYDFFLMEEQRLFFLIGDVAGKGIPASLFMALTKALYKSSALRRRAAIGAIMTEVGCEIARENPESMFVTMFAGILDLATGELEYANAGHDPPFILRPGQAPTQLLSVGGPPLCAVDDFEYPAEQAVLQAGECLVLFTDGVPEAQNDDGQLYSMTRVAAALAAAPETGPEQVIARLIADVRRFTDGAEPADDIAILALRRNAPAVSAP